MTTAYEVPLIPAPQTLRVPLGGINYQLRVYWSDPATAWILDINDEGGAPVVLGLAIVTGVNLLEQFDYLGFLGRLEAQTDHDLHAPPSKTNLGVTSHLYLVVP
jgi:hypothetical protein